MAPSSFYFFTLLLLPVVVHCSRGCDRGMSRLVRKVVQEKLMPAFTTLSAELSEECLFSLERDRYRIQEGHKSVEDGVNWYCHFCGKAFMTEYFLDLHFDNRHADQLQSENSVCLADMCELFRCDVIGRRVVPDFWDVALCLEDDMKILHHKCSLMVKSCVPSGLTDNETQRLTDITMQELCSYLTCSKYWETLFESKITEGATALYIIMVVMIIFAVIIYYFIFFAYFYTDAFSDSVVPSASELRRSSTTYKPAVRHRKRPFPASPPD